MTTKGAKFDSCETAQGIVRTNPWFQARHDCNTLDKLEFLPWAGDEMLYSIVEGGGVLTQ